MNIEEIQIENLKTILNFTKIINTSNDLDYILNTFMNKTLELLHRADIGVIFLYDKKRNLLDLKTGVGFGNINISLKPGESITGITFNKKKIMHLKNYSELKKMMNTMDNTKYKRLQNKIDKPMKNIQSSISCPLMYKENCIGVLVIDNYYGKEPLNENDVYLVELIANNATIAISNALNYEKIISNQKALKKYSKIIEKEKNRYEYSTFLHDKFTEMVLNGNSISDIVNEVSSILNHDVFTLDLFHNITNYNLKHHTNMEFLNKNKHYIFSKLDNNRHIHKYLIDNFYFFINPITINNEILGWIGIISNNKQLKKFEKISIDKSSTIIALEMLKNNEISNMEESLKGDFFSNLLKNKNSKFMDNFCKKYNYDKNGIHQIIIIKLIYPNINSSIYTKINYLYYKVKKIIKKNFDQSVIILNNNYIITIFNKNKYFNRKFISSIIDEITEKFEFFSPFLEVKLDYKIIVSEEIKNNADFGLIYNNAMNLFNINSIKTSNKTVYFYEDFEIKKFLLNNDQEDLIKFANKILGSLLNYKHSSKDELLKTLIIYIKTGKEWKKTKNILHIHGNTLTYRINRLQELLNLDFSNYYDLFKLKIALEIIELYPNKSSR